MKLLIIFILLLSFKYSFAQNSDVNLNGNIFRGTATEITSPDIGRMPIVIDETISFQNGKVVSDILKGYSVNDCNYSSEIDDRRTIAFTIVKFNVSANGNDRGCNVTMDFSGEVIGYSSLVGTIIIRYSDNSEVKYSIQAQSN